GSTASLPGRSVPLELIPASNLAVLLPVVLVTVSATTRARDGHAQEEEKHGGSSGLEERSRSMSKHLESPCLRDLAARHRPEAIRWERLHGPVPMGTLCVTRDLQRRTRSTRVRRGKWPPESPSSSR